MFADALYSVAMSILFDPSRDAGATVLPAFVTNLTQAQGNATLSSHAQVLYRTVGKSVTCGDECIAAAVLGCLTLLIALYDAYNINTCLVPWASRRHLTNMVMTTGLYSFFNACFAVFPLEANMWGGLMALLRIFFVLAYLRVEMCMLCVDGYGDPDEMEERVGDVLSRLKQEPKGPQLDRKFVQSCVFRIKIWVAQSVLSFIIKIVCNTYGVLTVFEGPAPGGLGPSARFRVWSGGFIYIVLFDVLFMGICKSGQRKLSLYIEPLLRPDSRQLIRGRVHLFNLFYPFITMAYTSLISLVFMCNVGVDDFTYTWWRKHQAIFVAASMLPYQWAVHRYYVPGFHWSFSTKMLQYMKKHVQQREDIKPFLKKFNIVIYADPAEAGPGGMEAAVDAKVTTKADEEDGKSQPGRMHTE